MGYKYFLKMLVEEIKPSTGKLISKYPQVKYTLGQKMMCQNYNEIWHNTRQKYNYFIPNKLFIYM